MGNETDLSYSTEIQFGRIIKLVFVMKHKSQLHSIGFERIKQNLKTIIGKEDQFAKVIVGQ